MELDYSIKSRHRPRINFRLVLLLGLACLPFAWIFMTFMRDVTSGGIVNQGEYVAVDLKALGQFPFDKIAGRITDVPARYRDLDGKRVAMEGFMYAGMSAGREASHCEFVYNIQKCCFSGPPQVQERVFLKSAPGKAMPLYDYGTMVQVVGKLHVGLQKDDQGTVTSVYEMVPDAITPKS